MQKYQSIISGTNGSVIRNVPVTVLKEDGSLAEIFMDREGQVQAPNPLVTDSRGVFYFYAKNGRYSLRTAADGVQITDADTVLLFDPDETASDGPIADAVRRAEDAAERAETALSDSDLQSMVQDAQDAAANAVQAVIDANQAVASIDAALIEAGEAKDAAQAAAQTASNAASGAQAVKDSLLTYSGTLSATPEWSAVPSHADPALDAQTQAALNRVEKLKDDQQLLKQRADKTVLSYPDYAAASAAAATLPDGQVVLVRANEAIQGSPPYQYKIESGTLVPIGYVSAMKLPTGSKNEGVYYRYGKIYESNGTVEKNEVRPWLHDFRPTVADGSDFNTDGANLFIGHGAGNFTMKAVPIGVLPSGKDYSLQCSHNIGFGIQALGSLTIGYKNTGIGTNAFRKLTEGHGNTALGRDAGHELTTGNENTSLGFTAAQLAQTGNYNTSVGTGSFYNNAGGSGNVAVGRRAAFSFTSGNYNVAIGEQSATGHFSGDYNTIIGKQAANNGITTGSNNTVIGARVTGLEDASGQVVLASGDGTKLLEINPNGTGKSKLDLVSKNTTAVNLAATDGQVDAGSTLVLRSAANVGSAITQIAFQSRTGQPWSRLVSWGGATPNISVVTNNAEAARWNSSGDLIQKVNGTGPALGVNSTMTFELTSNTELKIKVRGSDGVTRSASIALA